ncbi:Sodium/calcium exchanger protein-domain-containing protein [Sporodiniella umbellata]|nr:Sodium/calcium exchanger protein-domain-containing protein [Sporodiniella umbellata]
MALKKHTVLIISIILTAQCITYSWKGIHPSIQHLAKRDELKCDDVHLQLDQCAHVLQHCNDTTPGLVNYIQWYYCSSAKPIVFILMCSWLLFLFGFVGIAASDFFCPNLQTIASALHLSESLTGVTFLAFGNGSPDLFSTFSAMHSNLGSLALGELIGAAAFIVSVVAGSMCAIKPFRAKKFSFIRDVSFFTCAILLVMMIVSDGLIHLYEGIILIVFYVIYVLVVVGGNYYMKRRSNYLNLVERARSEYEENERDIDNLIRGNILNSEPDRNADEMELYDEGFETEGYQELMHSRNNTHPGLRIRASLFSAIEFQDVVQSLQDTSGNFQYRRRQPMAASSSYERYTDNVSLHTPETRQGDQVDDSVDTVQHWTQKIFSPSTYRLRREIVFCLFPTLVDFRQKPFFSKISSAMSAPVVFLLTITLPVVDKRGSGNIELNDETAELLHGRFEEDRHQESVATRRDWNKWLTATQLIGAPALISFILVTQVGLPSVIIFPVILGTGVILSTLFWLTTSQRRRPRLYWLMCFVGFGVAIFWIFFIANEVVSVLQAVGMALGISEAVLGLTIFAMGNSLGDFVANVTMAKLGYPLMAMSACFGGPMLNIMLGVGIGATYVTSQRNEPYAIELSNTIVVSAIGLLIILISSLILVPLNGYRMSKTFGYSWIAIYLICTAINLYIEIRS